MLCCPRCGSLDVYEELGGYTGNIYRCKKCGYRGALILEIGEEEEGGPKEKSTREKKPERRRD